MNGGSVKLIKGDDFEYFAVRVIIQNAIAQKKLMSRETEAIRRLKSELTTAILSSEQNPSISDDRIDKKKDRDEGASARDGVSLKERNP
ncbi:hypothetical protein HDU67_007665 [Dinochytrium kinnereticum]|nr:hypothetical protein HDU67_007665 [Dinochytrium kinnereticum]